MWPASMLAKRRTERLIGRDRNEIISIGDDQRQQHAGHAVRHEQLEEAEAVLVEAVDDDRADHQHRQREGDDDLAGDGEEIGNMPSMLATSTNMNSENTSGKNFMPCVPAPSRSMSATNS